MLSKQTVHFALIQHYHREREREIVYMVYTPIYCSSWHTQCMHKPIFVSSRSGNPCTTYHVHRVFKFWAWLCILFYIPHLIHRRNVSISFCDVVVVIGSKQTCAFAGKCAKKIQFKMKLKKIARAQGSSNIEMFTARIIKLLLRYLLDYFSTPCVLH